MAIFRTRALFHVFESRGIRGYFKVYNYKKKKWLILGGQKTMSYKVKGLWTDFSGRFYGKFALGDDEIDKKYRIKKEKALADSEKTSMTSAQVRYRDQRDLILFLFRKHTKMKYQEMSNLLMNYELSISFQQLARICAKFGDGSNYNTDNKTKKEENDDKNEDFDDN